MMFLQLRKRIIHYIIIVSILFTLIIGLVSFIFISQSFYKNFKNSADENMIHSINNSTFAVETAKNTTTQIAQNASVLFALNSEEYSIKVNPILNSLKNTSFGIGGVTLYTDHGSLYSTSSISSHLSLEDMKSNPQISQFMDQSQTDYLSIRTTQINAIYNHIRYDETYGMITYIVKLKDDTGLVSGYLFVDINPSYIYNTFFSYENYNNYKHVETFLYVNDDTYLKSEQNTSSHAKYTNNIGTEQIKVSKDKKYLIISKPIFTEQYHVVSLVPMTPYYNYLWRIGLTILFSVLILIPVASLIAIKIANTITMPLSLLHQKISQSDLEL